MACQTSRLFLFQFNVYNYILRKEINCKEEEEEKQSDEGEERNQK